MESDGVAAAAEMEDLVGHCLELAERLLNKHGGEFREFAGCVDAAGVTSTGLDVGEGLTHEERVAHFAGAVRRKAERGEVRAAAVCVRVTMCQTDPDTGEESDETDAVYVSCEHRDSSEAFVDVTPFERTFGLRRRWKLGQRYRIPAPRSIFDDPEGS